jgi:phage-related protein
MSDPTYTASVQKADRPLLWLHGEIKTPPFSSAARIEAGVLLRRLQRGESIALPHSRPMPDVGKACHELRVNDETRTWRIMYHVDVDAVVILEVFSKTSRATPVAVMETCRKRLKQYLAAARGKETKR